MLRDWLEDVRFGVRQFARTPVLTAIALITLALGIGANAAVFSLLDSYLTDRLSACVNRSGINSQRREFR
jgi:hypothetical protein